MLSTVLYYELAMKVPIPVGITVYLLTWGLGHLRCLVDKSFEDIWLTADNCIDRRDVTSEGTKQRK